jgi:hypothetical protein
MLVRDKHSSLFNQFIIYEELYYKIGSWLQILKKLFPFLTGGDKLVCLAKQSRFGGTFE